jgi:hypothetical protein
VGIAAFSIAKRRIDDITGGALKGSLGNALWLGLAAAVRADGVRVVQEGIDFNLIRNDRSY